MTTRVHRRRFMAIVAALAVAGTGSVACGNDDDGDAGDGNVTITFWTHTHPPMIELNEKLIAEYQSKNPNVKIEYQTIPNTEFGTKMLTSLSTGRAGHHKWTTTRWRGEYLPNGCSRRSTGRVRQVVGRGARGRYVPGTLDGAKDARQAGRRAQRVHRHRVRHQHKHFKDAGSTPPPAQTWQDVLAAGRSSRAPATAGFNSSICTRLVQPVVPDAGQPDGGSILSPDGKTAQLTSRAAWRRSSCGGAGSTSGIADPKTSSRTRPRRTRTWQRGCSRGDRLPVVDGPDQGPNPDTYKDLAVRAAAHRRTVGHSRSAGCYGYSGRSTTRARARPRRGSSSRTWPARGTGGSPT